MNYCHAHPENPNCTEAYTLVAKGRREKARQILTQIGYQDVEAQINMIEGFIKFQETRNATNRRNSRVR